MTKRKYVIERLVKRDEYKPVSDLLYNPSRMWKETSWPAHTSLSWLKKQFGYEYRKVKHDR
jgi:hypothetical protein